MAPKGNVLSSSNHVNRAVKSPSASRRQSVYGLQKRQQQGLDHGARAEDPSGYAVDARIKEVQADMRPAQVIATDQLLRDRREFIRERYDVVAVPAHTPANVKQNLVQPTQHGRNFIRDDFRWMEMPGI